MKNQRNKKMSLLFGIMSAGMIFTALFGPDELVQALIENEFIRELKVKMEKYRQTFPEDRVYVQMDKTLYAPGETIWLSAYVTEAGSLKPSQVSDIVYVELISPKGSVEKTLSLVTKKGKAAADFSLEAGAPGGMYKVRAYTKWMKNVAEDNAFEKTLQVQEVIIPDLKFKLDFLKKAYGPGAEVMARINLSNKENKQLEKQKLKYVLNVKGSKVLEGTTETDKDGEAVVKCTLPAGLNSTDVLLNIITDYEGGSESISRTVPVVLNKISLEIFPEGGDLVNALPGRVAFKASNEFGKPADVEGFVYSLNGVRTGTFSSFHQGMGGFDLTPVKGQRYFMKITQPAGIRDSFELPAAWDKGLSMQVDQSENENAEVNINVTEPGEISLVAQVRGVVYYNTVVEVKKGSNRIKFPLSSFPSGVAQITVFDDLGIPRAERLCFVNRDRQMKIDIQTDKQKYLPREKVKMTITVKDEKGMPVPANLSMAVVNDQLLSMADDRSGHLVSQMLLEQDLKQKVEEPRFYFDPKEAKSLKALDYLLMTSGWRRFTWEQLLEQEIPAITYPGEKAIIKATFLDAYTSKPLGNTKIMNGKKQLAITDSKGEFQISGLDLSKDNTITAEHEGYYAVSQQVYEYGTGQTYYMYPVDHRQYPVATKSVRAMKLNFENRVQNEEAGGMGAADREDMVMMAPMAMAVAEANEPMHKEFEKKAEKRIVVDLGDKKMKAKMDWMDDNILNEVEQAGVRYYRARAFPQKNYLNTPAPSSRNDFRTTLFWDPAVEVGYSGKKTIEFFTGDDVSSYRAVIEGISKNGLAGRTEHTLFTQLPFSINCKMPIQLTAGDQINLPVILKNNTPGPLGGVLSLNTGSEISCASGKTIVATVMPGETSVVMLPISALEANNACSFNLSYKSCGFDDAISHSVKIVSRGFPVQQSFSSQEADKEYKVEINHLVKGSLRATFTAYPNVLTDLMKGVEGILSEPYGCFEQTSCTAYPNAMVLDYLKVSGNNDSRLMTRAEDLLDRGYKRLTSFEAPAKGYEWFGANPAHEGLTAYGVMEFVDMMKAGQKVDQQMLDRTVKWLMSHKDGKGGFAREQRALHDFGRISDDVMNGYIVYALSEAGYTDLQKEFDLAHEKASKSGDAYLLAMNCNAAYARGDVSTGAALLKQLFSKQEADGSLNGSSHSITYSQGRSLTIETTALSLMAMLKSKQPDVAAMQKAATYLVGSRSASGVFSSTQGTILALKSLTAFSKFNKRTAESGSIVVYIDGKKVKEQKYEAGQSGEISIAGLEQQLSEGKHHIRIKYEGTKNPLPYSVAVNWSTNLPEADEDCKLDLNVQMFQTKIKVGETARMSIKLENKSATDIPSSMVLIGIPAGMSAQPWQLKEMQEQKVFDYYEIKGTTLALYYRGMEVHAKKEINFDLKAEVPGEFESSASSAYLYYTNEFKSWAAPVRISIQK